jgi:hypothetical protein
MDRRNIIEVSFQHDPMLTSCDDAALAAGANLAWINQEFLQFATVEPLGEGRYQLRDLVRGKFGSEPARAHPAGSPFLLLNAAAFRSVTVGSECIGSTLTAEVRGPDGSRASSSLAVAGLASKPWRPAHLRVSDSQQGLHVNWVRRSKQGGPWLDFVDAPVGSSREAYLMRISGEFEQVLERQALEPAITVDLQAMSMLGPRPWKIEVRQLGDFTASEPLTGTII